MDVIEVFLTLFIIYFLIGLIFTSIILIIVPNEYKDQVHTTKAIEVLVFLWPLILIPALNRIIIDK